MAGVFLDASEQATVLEPGRVKVVGQRAELVGIGFGQRGAVAQDFSHLRIVVAEHLGGPVEAELHGHEVLDGAIVERVGNPAPLVLLDDREALPEATDFLFAAAVHHAILASAIHSATLRNP